MLFSKISKQAFFRLPNLIIFAIKKKQQNNDFPVVENILPDILSLCALSLSEKEYSLKGQISGACDVQN